MTLRTIPSLKEARVAIRPHGEGTDEPYRMNAVDISSLEVREIYVAVDDLDSAVQDHSLDCACARCGEFVLLLSEAARRDSVERKRRLSLQ